jgi:hypothetical protein
MAALNQSGQDHDLARLVARAPRRKPLELRPLTVHCPGTTCGHDVVGARTMVYNVGLGGCGFVTGTRILVIGVGNCCFSLQLSSTSGRNVCGEIHCFTERS